MTRIYNRSFRAEDADGHPISGAQVTLWDSKTGGTQLVDGITDMTGSPIAGGVLTTDTWGYLPDFQDALDRPDVWAIGSLTGAITGVERVLLESSSDDSRLTALESFTQGVGGLDERLTDVEDSRGAANGIATLDASGKVPAAQLNIATTTPGGLNVVDYGATGDGVTDDAPAIQAALDAATASPGGSKVTVPPGTYLIGAELEIKGSLWLDLMPGATIKRGSSSMQYMIRNFNSAYAPTGYGGRGGIRISGGVWDGNASTYTTSCTNIIFAHADGIRVEGVTSQNVVDWHAVEINSSKNVVVRDCTFQGFRIVTAGREISEAVQIDLAINSAALPGIGAGAYDNTPCSNVLIQGNTVRAFGSYGAFGCLTGSHSWADGNQHRNVRVIGNHADGLSNYLCDLSNYSNVVISDNTCINSNGFVRINLPASMTADLTGFVISDNIARNLGVKNQAPSVLANAIAITGQDAITTGSFINDVAFIGNVFETAANHTTDFALFLNVIDLNYTGGSIANVTAAVPAIHVTGCRSAHVGDVKLRNITGRGIVIDQGASATSIGANVDGSVIEGVNDYAIDLQSWAGAVRNCVLMSPNTSGKALIKISNGATDNIVTNNLVWRRDGSTSANGIEISTSGSAGNKNQLLVSNIVKGFGTNTSTAASGVTGTGVWAINGNVTLNPAIANFFSTPTSGAPNNYYTATN